MFFNMMVGELVGFKEEERVAVVGPVLGFRVTAHVGVMLGILDGCLLSESREVGCKLGRNEGSLMGGYDVATVGSRVGNADGLRVGFPDLEGVVVVGQKVGSIGDNLVGDKEGILLGFILGRSDGTPIGVGVAALFVFNKVEVGLIVGNRLEEGPLVATLGEISVNFIAFFSKIKFFFAGTVSVLSTKRYDESSLCLKLDLLVFE